MKNLHLKSMLMVSHKEKKARKVNFDDNITVIQGTNDTGKSSVIKSIPWVFGAEPHKLHHKWINANIAVLLKFTLDHDEYALYRHKDSFTLFDGKDNEIGTYRSVTNELGPVLAKLFNFKLKLVNRGGKSVIPPPAFLMLPFYIDQDKGWTDTWSSFKNLGQFSRWQKRVIGYHFGLRPDNWYELEAEKGQLKTEQEEPNRQLSSINAIKTRTEKDFVRNDFDIDIEDFKKEINQLLEKCDELKIDEQSYRNHMTIHRTDKIKLEAQIEIVVRTHDELSDDYKYAAEITDELVGCPTCGAEYENSFLERFEIAQDTQTCNDLLSSLRNDSRKLNETISILEKSLDNNQVKQKEIRALLSSRQGKIKLKDLIKNEGKKSLVKLIKAESTQYLQVIEGIDKKIEDIDNKMAKYESAERKKIIISDYAEDFRKYTSALGVYSLSDSVYKNIAANVVESGSDMPRAILAYFFSAIKAIKKNGNATLFPIIIDSPNQQEQDKDNLEKILNFIYKNKDPKQQAIVALVEDADVAFNGKKISFDKKYSVLNEEDYEKLAKEIELYEKVNLSI